MARQTAEMERRRPPRRWGWFAFWLGTLFLVLVMIGVWFGWNVARVRERQAALDSLENIKTQSLHGQRHPIVLPANANLPTPAWRSLPGTWRLLGAEPVWRITLHPPQFNEDDRQYLKRIFPEAVVELSSMP
jgi:hypothetical protein